MIFSPLLLVENPMGISTSRAEFRFNFAEFRPTEKANGYKEKREDSEHFTANPLHFATSIFELDNVTGRCRPFSADWQKSKWNRLMPWPMHLHLNRPVVTPDLHLRRVWPLSSELSVRKTSRPKQIPRLHRDKCDYTNGFVGLNFFFSSKTKYS